MRLREEVDTHYTTSPYQEKVVDSTPGKVLKTFPTRKEVQGKTMCLTWPWNTMGFYSRAMSVCLLCVHTGYRKKYAITVY